jgi:hypothetical protein
MGVKVPNGQFPEVKIDCPNCRANRAAQVILVDHDNRPVVVYCLGCHLALRVEDPACQAE